VSCAFYFVGIALLLLFVGCGEVYRGAMSEADFRARYLGNMDPKVFRLQYEPQKSGAILAALYGPGDKLIPVLKSAGYDLKSSNDLEVAVILSRASAAAEGGRRPAWFAIPKGEESAWITLYRKDVEITVVAVPAENKAFFIVVGQGHATRSDIPPVNR